MPPEVLYATTDDGTSLPIIDVTNPAFTAIATEAELAAMAQKAIADTQQMGPMTDEVREVLRRSILGRGLMDAVGTFLSGLNTYRFKLGPNNFGPDANPIDQRIAGSFAAFTMRLRLQDMARMLADRLAPILAASPQRTLSFINIAGGPAADTWNTLIHLQAEHPALLANRPISITVLDLDTHGPSFGSRALHTLRQPNAPLHGLHIHHQHLPYEWSQTDRLSEILTTLNSDNTISAISSEGGLFEYGSDEQIIANLKELHTSTAPDAVIVGSVTAPNEFMRASHESIRIPVIPRTLEAFQHLVTQAGWTVHHTIERSMSNNVRLTKS